MMRRQRWRAVAALGVAVSMLMLARPALAADVAVVADHRDDPFVVRLVQELEQLGFSIAPLESVASSQDVAVLEVSNGALELQVRAADGSRTKQRLSASMADPLKAAEEVHALLLPLIAPPPPPEPSPAPALATTASQPRREEPAPPPALPPSQVELSAGAGALLGTSAPGLGVTLAGALFPRGMRVGPTSLGVGLGGLVAALPERVSSSAGDADVRAFVGDVELIARFAGVAPFVADVAVGASLNHVRFQGQARAPFTSREESATSVSPTLRLRASYVFGQLAVYADGRAGVAFPQVAVRFAGESVAEWGRPWVCLGGGVALSL